MSTQEMLIAEINSLANTALQIQILLEKNPRDKWLLHQLNKTEDRIEQKTIKLSKLI